MLRSISRHSRRTPIISVGKSVLLAALLVPTVLTFLLAHPSLPALAAAHTQLSALAISAPSALIRPSDPCNGSTLPC